MGACAQKLPERIPSNVVRTESVALKDLPSASDFQSIGENMPQNGSQVWLKKISGLAKRFGFHWSRKSFRHRTRDVSHWLHSG